MALTIAGVDPTGGAGLFADIRTFASFGLHGMGVSTGIAVQNTLGVSQIFRAAPEEVQAQLELLLADVKPAIIKTGMLATAEVVSVIAKVLRDRKIPLVVDPVVLSSSGAPLLDPEGVARLQEELLPLASAVTPNLWEAGILGGLALQDVEGAGEAAQAIGEKFGIAHVVVTGGHLNGDPVDVLYSQGNLTQLPGSRVLLSGAGVHGTGCLFASAFAAQLALGLPAVQAASTAKAFVTRAIEGAYRGGSGALLAFIPPSF